MIAESAAVAPDLVQDIFFGASMIVSGAVIVYTAVKAGLKGLFTQVIAFFTLAASVYGTFYL